MAVQTINAKAWAKSQGIVVDHTAISYKASPALILTGSEQKVTGWGVEGVNENVTLVDDAFSFDTPGRMSLVLSRAYVNTDQNFGTEVNIYIVVRKNGAVLFERNFPIAEAKSANSRSSIDPTTGEVFEFLNTDTIEVFAYAVGTFTAGAITLRDVYISGTKVKETES